jgi:hypothetical protein
VKLPRQIGLDCPLAFAQAFRNPSLRPPQADHDEKHDHRRAPFASTGY